MILRSLFEEPVNLAQRIWGTIYFNSPYLNSFYISSFYLSSPSSTSNSSSSESLFSKLWAILFYAIEPTSGPAPDHAELAECGPLAAGYERWRIYSVDGLARSPAFSFGRGWGLRSPGASAGSTGGHSRGHRAYTSWAIHFIVWSSCCTGSGGFYSIRALSIWALSFLGWSSYISSTWAICTSFGPASFTGSIICTSTGPEWACTGSLTGSGFLFPFFLNSFIIISSLVNLII